MVNGLPSTVSYAYDAANRLTSVNNINYTWDNNGNLLNDGANSYVYDSANRLSSVTNQTSTSSYQYNGLGDRLQQTVNGAATNYTSGYITQGEANQADLIVSKLQNYGVTIKKDWGFPENEAYWTYWYNDPVDSSKSGIRVVCNQWNDGLWLLDDLTAVNAAVHIMSAGIHFLGGHFNSLVGPVTISREKGGQSTADPGLVHYRVDGTMRQYKLMVAIHETGHVTMFNNMQTLTYFANRLGIKCLNGSTYCYTNDPTKAAAIYDPGPQKGQLDPTYGYSNMPSFYATQGDFEDYAETFRVTVVSSYLNSGNMNYIDDARLVYNYAGTNYNIGMRHAVMKAIINGTWR